MLPLRDLVVFPHMVSPVFLPQEMPLLAVEEAQINDQTVIALTQRDPEMDEPGPEDFFPIGVEMAVGRLLSMPDNSSSALVQGRRRVEVVEFVQIEPYHGCRARPIYETLEVDRQTDATMRTALEMFHKCVQLDRSLPEEAYLFALNIEEPGWLADMIVTAIAPPFQDRQDLLRHPRSARTPEAGDPLLAKEADVLELEDEIHSRAQSEVDRTQREFYLREQMKVIQTELGEGDPWTREIYELQTRIESAELPEEVQVRALKEVERLSQMPPMSPEVGSSAPISNGSWTCPGARAPKIIWMCAMLPMSWSTTIMGCRSAKERILEYIAVRSLKPKAPAPADPVLCRPARTGKTSLGRSIAEALGRKFVRLSLGGVRDEAEIRGHRRTYIGALPGRILQTMRRAGTINPCLCWTRSISWVRISAAIRPRPCWKCSIPSRTLPFLTITSSCPTICPGHVHHNRQHHRHHPTGPAGPHGADRVPRLHRRRETGNRPPIPDPPPDGREWAWRPAKLHFPTGCCSA